MSFEMLPCDFCTEGNRFARKPNVIKRALGGLGIFYTKCPGPSELMLQTAEVEQLSPLQDSREPVLVFKTESVQRCPGEIIDPTLSSIGEHVITQTQRVQVSSQQ